MKYKRFNATSILIEWPQIIDNKILEDILAFKSILVEYYFNTTIEITTSYSAILIRFFDKNIHIENEISVLKSKYKTENYKTLQQPKQWEIPVCYDDEFGEDLNQLSTKINIPKAELIKQHYSTIYTVYFIGFLPGFLYLGGLKKSLYCARKSTPSLNVSKGAVGIGGQQTGIYPQNSPGGWHIIGNSPINFFNVKNSKPCFATAGDTIKFIPISKTEHTAIAEQIENNKYTLKFTMLK